jgi:hypothetical protein
MVRIPERLNTGRNCRPLFRNSYEEIGNLPDGGLDPHFLHGNVSDDGRLNQREWGRGQPCGLTSLNKPSRAAGTVNSLPSFVPYRKQEPNCLDLPEGNTDVTQPG